MLSVGGFLFETGAVLGRGFPSKLKVFAYPYCGAEPDNPVLEEFMREEAREVDRLTSEAETVQELIMFNTMRQESPTASKDDLGDWLKKRVRSEIDERTAMEWSIGIAAVGPGFGAEFPQRFANLYVNSYARQDSEERRALVRAGLNIAAEPEEFVPLETRTENDLSLFAGYCAEFYPTLIAELGLEEYVDRQSA